MTQDILTQVASHLAAWMGSVAVWGAVALFVVFGLLEIAASWGEWSPPRLPRVGRLGLTRARTVLRTDESTRLGERKPFPLLGRW